MVGSTCPDRRRTTDRRFCNLGDPTVGKKKASDEPTLGELVREIAKDAETLIDQQFDLLRSEWRQELDQAKGAAAALGTGSVMVATGGFLTTLMLVHGLHRATRLPLWACYGLVGGAAGAVGVGLLAGGLRQAADVHLAAPPQTLDAMKENLAWIADQANQMTSTDPIERRSLADD